MDLVSIILHFTKIGIKILLAYSYFLIILVKLLFDNILKSDTSLFLKFSSKKYLFSLIFIVFNDWILFWIFLGSQGIYLFFSSFFFIFLIYFISIHTLYGLSSILNDYFRIKYFNKIDYLFKIFLEIYLYLIFFSLVNLIV